jgi:GNAT superfamily N-acetyltransferase
MLRHAIPDIELRARLADRGLECHLLAEEPGVHPSSFASKLRAELDPLLQAAYDREVTDAHLRYETWAVVIGPPTGPPVACATLSFARGAASCFLTRFEAVHPHVQKTGLGRLLYDCLAVWARFLVFSDALVQEGVAGSGGQYFLASFVDADPAEEADEEDCWDAGEDNVQGHGAFLRKLGFIRAQHDFGQNDDEIAFQREFHVPVEAAP